MERECGRCFCLLNKDCKYTCIKMNMSTHMDSINPFIIPIVWWLREYACVHVHCMLCRNELLSHHSVWLPLLSVLFVVSSLYGSVTLILTCLYERCGTFLQHCTASLTQYSSSHNPCSQSPLPPLLISILGLDGTFSDFKSNRSQCIFTSILVLLCLYHTRFNCS